MQCVGLKLYSVFVSVFFCFHVTFGALKANDEQRVDLEIKACFIRQLEVYTDKLNEVRNEMKSQIWALMNTTPGAGCQHLSQPLME